MISNLKKYYSKLDIHTAEVVRKSAASTVVKVAGMLIGLAVSIFLGRILGAEGLGIINLSNRIVQLLIIVGLLGMRQVIIKEIAIAKSKNDIEHIGNVMYTAYVLNGGITIAISIIFILFTPWLTKYVFHEPRLTWPLIIAVAVMTPQVFSRIFSSGLIGYRKIWQSNLVEQTLSIAIVGIGLLLMYILHIEITIVNTAIVYAVGRILVTISVGSYWKYLYHSNEKNKNKLIYKKLLKIAKPLYLVSITAIIATNSSTIMLGWLDNSKMVGLFTVAVRIALLTSFFLQVTNAAISPKLAALYAEGRTKEMEKMVQSVTGGLMLIALLALIILIVFGKNILSLWGADFSEAYFILVILSIGQFFNIGTGASGLLLIMCGLEKTYAKISTIFVVLNLVLNFVLIRQFGAIGAAIATSLAIIFNNIVRLLYVKTKLNITVIPFGQIFKTRP